MNKKQRDFVEILKCAISEFRSEKTDFNFDEIESISISNYCSSLVAYGATKCNIDIPKAWKNAASIILFRNYRNLDVQSRVLKKLNQGGIKCAVIKGLTAAVNYPSPMSRPLGDIDILVKNEDYEKAIALFGHIPENEHKFHFGFNYEGVSVEIHKAIDDYNNCLNGREISEIMSQSLENLMIVKFDNYEIPALENKYQAVVYLNHMIRHFDTNELSMRMFCDWICFVNSIDDNTWQNHVYPVVKRAGYDDFCNALNLVASKYMGISLESKVQKAISLNTIDLLMEEFVCDSKKHNTNFMDGNLASAYAKNDKKQQDFLRFGIYFLNELSRKKFKIAKYKVLLPFCWLYIALRYLCRVVTGKRNMFSYKRLDSLAKRKRKIKLDLNLK